MEPHPTVMYGVRQSLFTLVRDKSACMPTCASIQHVENNVLVDEQEVALDLLVESIRNVQTAHVVWARLGPHEAYLTRVAYFQD